MTTVFSVSHGEISQYKLVKETNCYYTVSNEYGEQRISKDGNSLSIRSGGRSTVTLDRKEASEAARKQIEMITERLKIEADRIVAAETALREFNQA